MDRKLNGSTCLFFEIEIDRQWVVRIHPRYPHSKGEMKHESYYISGKISGLTDMNKPKFSAAEALLRNKYGHRCYVINPHTVHHGDHDGSWEAFMKNDLRAMLRCECVVVLDDWSASRGATLEVLVAQLLKIPVYSIETMERIRVPLWVLLAKTLLNH